MKAKTYEATALAPGSYETQNLRAGGDNRARGYVWRCQHCHRYIGVIESLDGGLEVVHKCGALNRVRAVLQEVEPCEDVEARV